MTHPTDLPVNTVAVVNLGSLRHNTRLLLERARGMELIGVVKANAYGHGGAAVARILVREGVPRLAVATITEGATLRQAGVECPILVFAPPLLGTGSAYLRYELEAVVDSADAAGHLEAAGGRIACHVEIDTGMARVGVAPAEAAALIRRVETSAHLRLAGVMTHLADAESPGSGATERQLDRLDGILVDIGGAGGIDAPVHVANSAALFADEETRGRLASMGISGARTGIGLYGILDVPEDHPLSDIVAQLRPVMEFGTRVIAVRTVEAGSGVSYGGTWTSPGPRRIATLGAGYADGYPRLCSNRAIVGLPDVGATAPVVGRVCMDMTMIDLGPPDEAHTDVAPGAKVVLFGAGSPSCRDVARWAETITYEITCGVSSRVPRRVIDPDGG